MDRNRRRFLGNASAGLSLLGLPESLRAALPQHGALRERLKLPSGKVRMVLDTDTYNEVDDQFALAYALLSPDSMTVEAVYAAPFHNSRSEGPGDGMEKSYQEIHRVLDVLGDSAGPQYANRQRDEFVFRGSNRYLPGPGRTVKSPAVEDLIRRALASRDAPLYVLPIGAPTNVASALLLEPKIRDKIIVIWLGAQPYTMKSAVEFNCRQDVPASQTLYDSGVALINIPARNVSEHLRTTLPELSRFLEGQSKIGDYLYNVVAQYARERSPKADYPWSKVIWDISAIAVLVNPEWVTTEIVPSPILTDDITWKHEASRHPVRVATQVNRDAIFDDLFRKFAAS